MLVPFSKSKLKISSMKMVSFGVQTVKLKDPAEIRLPGCSALYS